MMREINGFPPIFGVLRLCESRLVFEKSLINPATNKIGFCPLSLRERGFSVDY